jgi:hypothetical protein
LALVVPPIQPFGLFSKRKPISRNLPERLSDGIILCAFRALLRFNSSTAVLICA